VHLVDLLAHRLLPGAGVSLALTRRCPLSCAHCATNSMMSSEQVAGAVLLRFVDTFGTQDPPQLLAMSGGEPLLRPRLVQELAERAHAVGTASTVLSGVFFARGRGRIPAAIQAAIDELDHFSVSLDVFHEREVPRANVLRVLDTVLAGGTDVSIQVVGLSADDPYLEEVTDEVRRVFDDRVPMFVNTVKARGRAADWLDAPLPAPLEQASADPCMLASWPLVGWDGTITACGNDDVVDGPAPEHLRLGHAATDGWPQIQARCRASSMVRAIRLYGPEQMAERFAAAATCSGDFCTTCMALSDDRAVEPLVSEVMARASTALLEKLVLDTQQRAGAITFARRYGTARYAELTALGAAA
jgi:pyruvate-formate lyase-activating enzyme